MEVANRELQTLVRIIRSKFGAIQIFLFGSYAYGTPSSDSDLDLCVIADLKGKRKIDLMREIRQEINPYIKKPLDILVYENDEFYRRAVHKGTLEYKILKQGLLIDG